MENRRRTPPRGWRWLFGLLVLGCSTPSFATFIALTPEIPVSFLLPSGSFTLDGKYIFSNFQFSSAATFGALPPPAGSVTVQGGIDDDGNPNTDDPYGIRIGLGLLAGPNQLANVNLSYKITVDPSHPDLKLNGVVLSLVNAGATGNGTVSVVESVYGPSLQNPPLASLTAVAIPSQGNGNPDLSQLVDQDTFTDTSTIQVFKDMSVGGGTAGSGHLSAVFQFYNDNEFHNVPEPSSLALLASTALFGLSGWSWRKIRGSRERKQGATR